MRTLKFISRLRNCVFPRCRQSQLRSQATNLETQKHTKWIEIDQSQITNHDLLNPLSKVCFLRGPLRWRTVAKNAIVSWLSNFTILIRMFVKSAVSLFKIKTQDILTFFFPSSENESYPITYLAVSIQPKIPEMSVGSDRNIRDQLWRWSTLTGLVISVGISHFFWKFSSGTNRRNVFDLTPNRKFRKFWLNGKRPLSKLLSPVPLFCILLTRLNNQTHGGLGRVCATGMYRSNGHVEFPKFQTEFFFFNSKRP